MRRMRRPIRNEDFIVLVASHRTCFDIIAQAHQRYNIATVYRRVWNEPDFFFIFVKVLILFFVWKENYKELIFEWKKKHKKKTLKHFNLVYNFTDRTEKFLFHYFSNSVNDLSLERVLNRFLVIFLAFSLHKTRFFQAAMKKRKWWIIKLL